MSKAMLKTLKFRECRMGCLGLERRTIKESFIGKGNSYWKNLVLVWKTILVYCPHFSSFVSSDRPWRSFYSQSRAPFLTSQMENRTPWHHVLDSSFLTDSRGTAVCGVICVAESQNPGTWWWEMLIFCLSLLYFFLELEDRCYIHS